jgi:hypothetical protein
MATRTKSTNIAAAKKATTKGEKQQSKNGVVRPKDGTSTGRVWAIADRITTRTKEHATRAAVLEAAEKEGINPATTATQFSRWRRFNGLKRETAKAE